MVSDCNMKKLDFKEYFKYPVEVRDKIDEFINNLNVLIETRYEGFDKEKLIKSLNIENEKDLISSIYKFRIDNGYIPLDIKIMDNALIIKERTISSEEEYIKLKRESIQLESLDLSKTNLHNLEEMTSNIKKIRKIIYEDLTSQFIDNKIKNEDIEIEDVFVLIEKMSILKGYKVRDISLGKNGLLVIEEYMKDDKEFKEMLNENIYLE